MKIEMDQKVIISRQSRHFFFVNNFIKVLFPVCTLIWLVNNYVSHQGKGINRSNESNFAIRGKNYDFGTVEVISVTIHF